MNKTIWKQADSRWGSKPYPTSKSTFAGNGCGCCACVHVAMEQDRYKDWTPENLRSWMISQGFAVAGQGTKWDGITQTLKHIGHKNVVWIQRKDPMSAAWKELNKGNRIGVLLVDNSKTPNGTVWTASGHYVAFTDYKLENGLHKFYIKDSGGRNHDGWFTYEKSIKGALPQLWIVERLDASAPKKVEGITLPSLNLKKTTAQVIADTITWAKWIAGDNSFHYGHGKDAHHNGCYFCGTQPKSKKNAGILDYQKTYCCNPFVGAAWAHGGCDQTALGLCRKGKSWDFKKGGGYDASKLFKNLGHPKKSELKAGDVLCRDTHVALYIGDGKIVQAGHEDDNKRNSSSWNSSIAVSTLTDKNYANFPRVHRYIGSVDVRDFLIRFGEVSDRVKLWQKFLNAYFGKSVCSVDGIFGAYTLKYTEDFQQDMNITVDGIIGSGTLAAAEKCIKEPAKEKSVYDFIDVSVWQGKIDWVKVKAAGIDGAIIRYADGTTLDTRFAENMSGAINAGLHVGAYIYSRAKTKAEAESEATRLFNACKPYKYDMPLYIDLEDKALSKYASTVAKAYLNKMKALGAKGGIYANLNWWNNYLKDVAQLSFAMWLAQYNSTMDYKPANYVGMWQYTSGGTVDGISGKVDRDKCYVAYWKSPSVAAQTWVDKANAWARKICADNRYHYNMWEQNIAQSHKCPICSKLDYNKDPDHFGWNCIGFGAAVWHHGGGLGNICKCGWITGPGGTGDKLLSLPFKDALALAKKSTGLDAIELIVNKNGIPKSEWKAGDICLKFSGTVFEHVFYYPGGKTVIDSTRIYNDKSKWTPAVIAKQIQERSWDNYSAKVIIRYTGK